MFKDKRTAMVGTLVLALFLSLLTLLTPGKALAAYDCFLGIPGIEGESTFKPVSIPLGIPQNQGLIDVVSWSFGGSQAGTTGAAAGRTSGKVTMQDFKLTMRTSKASPKLFQACASGTHLQKAVLLVRRPLSVGPAAGAAQQGVASGQLVEYLKITLEDVLVSSFVNLGNSGSAQAYPMEEVSLYFTKIEIEYYEIGPDGKLKPPVRVGYDVKMNKPS